MCMASLTGYADTHRPHDHHQGIRKLDQQLGAPLRPEPGEYPAARQDPDDRKIEPRRWSRPGGRQPTPEARLSRRPRWRPRSTTAAGRYPTAPDRDRTTTLPGPRIVFPRRRSGEQADVDRLRPDVLAQHVLASFDQPLFQAWPRATNSPLKPNPTRISSADDHQAQRGERRDHSAMTSCQALSSPK